MKVRLRISTGYAGCNHIDEIDVPDEEVEGMSDEELDKHLMEYAKDYMFERIDCSYEIVEE